jgi:transcriptional regulator of acetoin/glycerol metabolism
VDFADWAKDVQTGERHGPCPYCTDQAVGLFESSHALREQAAAASREIAKLLATGNVMATELAERLGIDRNVLYARTSRARKARK